MVFVTLFLASMNASLCSSSPVFLHFFSALLFSVLSFWTSTVYHGAYGRIVRDRCFQGACLSNKSVITLLKFSKRSAGHWDECVNSEEERRLALNASLSSDLKLRKDTVFTGRGVRDVCRVNVIDEWSDSAWSVTEIVRIMSALDLVKTRSRMWPRLWVGVVTFWDRLYVSRHCFELLTFWRVTIDVYVEVSNYEKLSFGQCCFSHKLREFRHERCKC